MSFQSVAVEQYSTTKICEMLSATLFQVEGDYTTIDRRSFNGNPPMGSHIRDRIKAARQHAKLSQEKLGEMIGVSKSAVSMWETANPEKYTKPTISNLKLISQITGAPTDWLLDDAADISTDWKSRVEIISFPSAATISETPKLGAIAIEAAKIIDSLGKSDQAQIIHYLRIHSQTTGRR